MKKYLLLISIVLLSLVAPNTIFAQGVFNKLKDKVNKSLDKPDDASKKKDDNASKETSTTSNASGTETAPLKVYANYDFVPGEKIIFEDNFVQDKDGEFPSHWELERGQAIINQLNGASCFYLTDGNYARVAPLTKTKSYLGTAFTIEYDVYNPENAAYGLICFMKDNEDNDVITVQTTTSEANCSFGTSDNNKSLSGTYPAALSFDNFKNKWHHVAIAYQDKQIKVYVDQFRVLVVPNAIVSPTHLDFGGIGDNANPSIFRNVKVAEGGGMYMLGKKFTDTKIVTHGINFDLNKSTIRPESMGTLNMIVQVMKDNPDIKFEIGGHTDSDGSDDANLKLSQQRADAVKDELVKMGIDAGRLTPKGYGKTKPISDNNSMEGKANNRRVEFVKI